MTPEECADRFFQLATEQDWDALGALFAPTAVVRQPGTGDFGVAQLLTNLRGLSKAGIRTAYESPRRVVSSDALVEQHDVRLTRADGVEVVVDICVVMRFQPDGLIVRVDEYFDSAAIAPLMV
ncbi:MAG: nuclear transport factor 2 family protein [Acidimicrobiales bacterium]